MVLMMSTALSSLGSHRGTEGKNRAVPAPYYNVTLRSYHTSNV